MAHRAARSAFSLTELTIVVTIIGVLAAVAVPRVSDIAGIAARAALQADLRLLQDAIHRYWLEHGQLPGPDAARFVQQLTQYSSADGQVSLDRDPQHPFGPYLVAIPPCPVGENAGKPTANQILISGTSVPIPSPASSDGWVYSPSSGRIRPNSASAAVTSAMEEVQGDAIAIETSGVAGH